MSTTTPPASTTPEDTPDHKAAVVENPGREDILLKSKPYRPGVRRVPVDRWFKQEYHDREIEMIWKKAWQWACRVEDIPEIGDYTIYEVGKLSFIIVRTSTDSFKAYWNSCPHRGRKLCTFDGKKATELRCMYHGWAWDIHGKMTNMTCGWDFPGVNEATHLPEVRTGTWGGFVFINPDPDGESLEAFLGELPAHFATCGQDHEDRWAQVHIVAHLDCNWKVVQEAFIENWHVRYTHPQMLMPPATGPARSMRWDDFGNWMRQLPARPDSDRPLPPGYNQQAENEQQFIDHDFDYHQNEINPHQLKPGESPMAYTRQHMRDTLREVIGDEVDDVPDIHMTAGGMVSVWPNFHPWGGMSRLTYRFRPYKNDPHRSVVDVVLLSPWPKDRPKPPPAKPHVLDFGQPITDAPELGWLARIFRQDLGNVVAVHDGMQTSGQGYVVMSSHHETPVRRWHDQYDRWMGIDNETGVLGDGQ